MGARRLGWGLAVAGLVLVTLEACSSTCEAGCDRQYAQCVERAPPGASRDDCAQQQRECYARCQSTPAPSPT